MAMSKFNQFVKDLLNGVHDFGSDSFKVALTNSAPAATNAVLADLTEISYTNCSSRALTFTSDDQTSGTAKVIFADLTLTASGGDIAAFRYIAIYNDTPTSPADPLIGWLDYGSSLTIHDGESLTLDFDNTNGLFTLA